MPTNRRRATHGLAPVPASPETSITPDVAGSVHPLTATLFVRELAPEAGVLRFLPRKQQRQARRRGAHRRSAAALERVGRLARIAREHVLPQLEGLASDLQREGGIGEVDPAFARLGRMAKAFTVLQGTEASARAWLEVVCVAYLFVRLLATDLTSGAGDDARIP